MNGSAAARRGRYYGAIETMIRAEWMALLRKASNHRCGICGEKLRGKPTIDHVLPLSRGGADMLGNVVPAHDGCNSWKAGAMPTGCELVWLLSINASLGVQPQTWRYP